MRINEKQLRFLAGRAKCAVDEEIVLSEKLSDPEREIIVFAMMPDEMNGLHYAKPAVIHEDGWGYYKMNGTGQLKFIPEKELNRMKRRKR